MRHADASVMFFCIDLKTVHANRKLFVCTEDWEPGASSEIKIELGTAFLNAPSKAWIIEESALIGFSSANTFIFEEGSYKNKFRPNYMCLQMQSLQIVHVNCYPRPGLHIHLWAACCVCCHRAAGSPRSNRTQALQLQKHVWLSHDSIFLIKFPSTELSRSLVFWDFSSQT